MVTKISQISRSTKYIIFRQVWGYFWHFLVIKKERSKEEMKIITDYQNLVSGVWILSLDFRFGGRGTGAVWTVASGQVCKTRCPLSS
jgi:hypothetical protein